MKKGDDTRKGFKFTKKVAATAPTETVSFDELDEEKSSPVGKKRRPPANLTERADLDDYDLKNGIHAEADESPASHSPTVDNNSNPIISKSPSSSSSRKISRTDSAFTQQPIANASAEFEFKRKKDLKKNDEADEIAKEEAKSNALKAYYPKINFDPSLSDVITSLANENSDVSHKDILMKLIAEICGIESSGLKEYSDENKGRETLITALQELLLRLPDDVAAAVKDTVVFMPELTTDEKIEIESLERTVAALKQHSLALQRYETDISEVGKKYNIWMHGADSVDATHSTGSSQQSLDIRSIAENYDEILHELNNHCGKLINLSESLDAVKTEARLAQSALYDTAQALRSKANNSKGGSEDPKDLIRSYLAL